jgi:carbamoyl-phosphate synthase large subunit
MKNSVLISGAGAPAAIGVIKSLRKISFKGKIVATDSDNLSAGLYLSDKAYVLPKASSNKFFDKALEIIKKEKINIIIPTSGFDIIPYSMNKKLLESMHIAVMISDYSVLETCINKWKFYLATKDYFNIPFTTLKIEEARFPCFIKPKYGKGSRDIFLCHSKKELKMLFKNRSDFIIQEYLPMEEYTVDVISDLSGKPLVAVPRVRISTRGGISVKGKIFHDFQIQNECLKIAEHLRLIGPSCMQLKKDKNGTFKFIEINPRMGGGTYFTTLAGINFPKILIDIANKQKLDIPDFEEITVLRYFEEIVI